MAAGEGRRLRPVTERWPKPVLPIDGRPVLASLLHELRDAGCERAWLVTGHLADQVERLAGDGSAFALDVRIVRQPAVLGSADATKRAVDAGARLPCIVVAADTLFRPGDIRSFWRAFEARGGVGALAVRRDPPPGPRRGAVEIEDGLVRSVGGTDSPLSAAPLWAIDGPVAEQLCRDREPYELGNAFKAAIADGGDVLAVEIGKTRDLTDPLDLVEENFPYLSA